MAWGAAISLGSKATDMGFGIYAAVKGAAAAEIAAENQVKIARYNEALAKAQAVDAVARAQAASSANRAKTTKFLGRQRATAAARGLDPTKDTAGAIVDDTKALAGLDAETIASEGPRKAAGYLQRAAQANIQGQIAAFVPDRGPSIASAVLGGAAGVASSWYTFANTQGLFDGD